MTCRNATQFINSIHNLRRWFAGSAMFRLARPLASRLTRLIAFFCRLTPNPRAGFNQKVAHVSTFSRVSLLSLTPFLFFIFFKIPSFAATPPPLPFTLSFIHFIADFLHTPMGTPDLIGTSRCRRLETERNLRVGCACRRPGNGTRDHLQPGVMPAKNKNRLTGYVPRAPDQPIWVCCIPVSYVEHLPVGRCCVGTRSGSH